MTTSTTPVNIALPINFNISLFTKQVLPSPFEVKKGKWSPEEDELLSSLVKTYNYKNWKLISQHIRGRTAIQCLHRWTKILQPGLVKGPWTAQEDAKLYEWVKVNGPTKWTLCSETIPGRSGKQCREHWNNSLNPEVKKGMWNTEEDFLIMHFYKKYNGSWKKISPLFDKRTENSIKNRFFSQLRKIASWHIQSKEKKFSSKIKLDTLLHYLDEAKQEAQDKFISEFKFNESDLNAYLDKMEKKLYEYEQTQSALMNVHNSNSNNNNNSKASNTNSKDKKECNVQQQQQHVLQHNSNNDELVLQEDKTKYDSYDLEMLEKELYAQCDNNQDIFNFDNEILFQNKIDSLINNAFNENVEIIQDGDKELECFMCGNGFAFGDFGCGECTTCGNNKNDKNDNKQNINDEYMNLLNKLIELQKKVQDTKKELKKLEMSKNNNSNEYIHNTNISG
jgi:hypothetical protein